MDWAHLWKAHIYIYGSRGACYAVFHIFQQHTFRVDETTVFLVDASRNSLVDSKHYSTQIVNQLNSLRQPNYNAHCCEQVKRQEK